MEQKYELLNFVTYIIQYLLQNTIIIKPIIKNMKRGRNMITQKEYELLKHYHATGYKWIAREKNGLVYAHKYKPFKDDPFWLANGLAYTIVSTPTGNIFKSITWEDEKPTKIDDLIRDYESHQVITGGNNVNKSELIKEIEDILDDIGVSDYQLGECDEDTIWTISSITFRKIFSAIEKHSSDDVKATVPQFVADWIEEVKALKRSFKLEILFDTTEMPDDVFDWLDERYGDTDILAKAWIDGYIVDEKEKLYTVRLANGNCLYRFLSLGIDWMKGYSDYKNDPSCRLTQSEIESVDPVLMKIAEEVAK